MIGVKEIIKNRVILNKNFVYALSNLSFYKNLKSLRCIWYVWKLFSKILLCF